MPRVTIICAHCRKEFTIYPSDPHKFCSRACVFAHWLATDEMSRFWAKVDKSGGPDACWPWTGARNSANYGNFNTRDGKTWPAHRLAWTLTNGPIQEGLLIRHYDCDNPPCCNPKHLLPGTLVDNRADSDRKGRARSGNHKGSANGRAKLTARDIQEIRALSAQGVYQDDIARQYHIGQTHVSRIVRRESWTHIP